MTSIIKNQLGIFLSIILVTAALGTAAGWYAGAERVKSASIRFDDLIQKQSNRIDDLEGTTLLIAQDAAALRGALVEQQLIAQEETSALRAALDEKVGELSSAVGSQEDKLANLADVADVSGLIDTWSPFVYDITCSLEDGEGTVSKSSGSATLEAKDGGVRFVTSRHIVEADGKDLIECRLERADADSIDVVADDIDISDEHDVAYGAIGPGPAAMTSANICATAPRIGERVLILGYPAIGAKESVTVTEGIISGFDEEYYTTSAKIEKGNSGGAAISIERDCFLGIPTLVFAGRIESLARILPALSL